MAPLPSRTPNNSQSSPPPLIMALAQLPHSSPHRPAAVHLNEASKQLYLHHEAVAKTLAGKDVLYQTAQTRARTSAKEAKRAAEIVSQISETEANLTAQLETLESKKIRKRLFPNKTNEHITKIRNNLTAVVEESALAKKAASESRRQARADARAREQLRGDAEKLQHSEKTRRAILEDVYGGLDVGSVEENSIESERDRLVRVTYHAKDSLSTQKEAYQLLKAAQEDLKQARRHLLDAQITNTVDVFNGGGFGFVAGISTQYRFQSAAKIAREAGKKIERAMNINPHLPIAKLAKVHNTVFLGFADIFLDGIVTDLVVRVAIEMAVKSVNETMESMAHSIECQKHVVEVAQGSLRGFSHELERTSDELTKVRAGLFHEAFQ